MAVSLGVPQGSETGLEALATLSQKAVPEAVCSFG